MKQINIDPHSGIHTFEVKRRFPTSAFCTVREAVGKTGKLFPLDHPPNGKEHKQFSVSGCKYPGIRIRLRQSDQWAPACNSEFHHNYLSLLVTPQGIVRHFRGQPCDPVEIFEPTLENSQLVAGYIESIYRDLGFESLFDSIKGQEVNLIPNGFESLTIARIDYCADLSLESDKMVKTYIKLARQGNFPARFKPSVRYDETAHRTKPYSGQVKYRGTTVAVLLYDKNEQLLNALKYEPGPAKGLLRFEIQAYSGKVRYLKYSRKLTNLGLLQCASEMSHYEFKEYMPQVFWSGCYLPQTSAVTVLKQAVKDGSLREKDRVLIETFMNEVDRIGGITEVFDAIESPYMRRKLRGLMDMQHINPVRLPASTAHELGVVSLPSIPCLLGLVADDAAKEASIA
ncbi:hypothetical protein LJC60_04845 [Ruminococcaceae bacterium OttesenSCG-928-D13]|nr:hypothetical protein [Ruminococcaceae bacterium OttesenSCG-928-D13]